MIRPGPEGRAARPDAPARGSAAGAERTRDRLLRDERVQDVLLAVVGSSVALLPLGVPALVLGELDRPTPPAVRVLLVLLQTLPLAASRRAPVSALAVTGSAWALAQLLGADTGLAGLALLVVLSRVGRYDDGRRVRTVVVGTVAYGAVVAGLVALGASERPIDWVTFWIVLAAPWLAGAAARARRRRQVEHERVLAARAVSDARGAIARDLHDVVTHHVTAMIVQAESTVFATEHLPPDDRTVALTEVGESGRSALRELRTLLDALDPDRVESTGRLGTPSGPADVRSLVDRLRATGYPVSLRVQDGVRLAPRASTVVHDVAREAVTNAMRHAPGAAVVLRIDRDDEGAVPTTVLTVENELPGGVAAAVAVPRGGRGRGIMAERLAAVGGALRAGPHHADGGDWTWRTVARLPAVAEGQDLDG